MPGRAERAVGGKSCRPRRQVLEHPGHAREARAGADPSASYLPRRILTGGPAAGRSSGRWLAAGHGAGTPGIRSRRHTAPMRQIETFAAEHGRDPGELDMILRVYPQEAATMDDAVEFLDRA